MAEIISEEIMVYTFPINSINSHVQQARQILSKKREKEKEKEKEREGKGEKERERRGRWGRERELTSKHYT